MKSIVLNLFTVIFISACCFNSSNKFIDEYRIDYTAGIIYRTRYDTIWHDVIPCFAFEEIDKVKQKEIDSLVNVSLQILWNKSDEGREFVGSRADFALSEECIAEEILRMHQSKEFYQLAKAYAKRKQKLKPISKIKNK